MRAHEFITEANWKQGLATAALAGLTSLTPVQAQHTPEYNPPPQLTQQQFEQELAHADSQYAKTGSARPYEDLARKLGNTWDMKDREYYKLINQVHQRAEAAKRENPVRNGKLGQIYHGERSIVPHI